MTTLAAAREVRCLLLAVAGSMSVSCGTFFWESDNRDYTSPPAKRTSLVYYSVVRDSTGEVVFEECFARSSHDEAYDDIEAPIGEAYSVTIQIGSRPGEVKTEAERRQACSSGPTTWEISYSNGRCLKLRDSVLHELVNAVVLDENGIAVPSATADSTLIVGVSAKLTLISTQAGPVAILQSQRPCACLGDCPVAYAFNVRELPAS
jgi:hypothetical protein